MSIRRAHRYALLVTVGAVALSAYAATPAASGASAHRANSNATDYEQVILSNRPAIYYRLGEAEGPTAVDSSGHGRDGVYQGRPGYGRTGAIVDDPDTQVEFNTGKSRDSVVWPTGDENYQGLFSVEAWVTPSDRHKRLHDVVNSRYANQFTFELALYGYPSHSIWVVLGNGRTLYIDKSFPFNWQAGDTYYLAVVAAARQLNIYVNGDLLATEPYSDHGMRTGFRPPVLYTPDSEVVIGQNPVVAIKSPFKGDIDEVAIYQHRLSADQVAAHFAAGQ